MKNNFFTSQFHPLFLVGLFLALILPILNFPPLFYPPDWGKTIIFRIILSVILFFFIWQISFKKINISDKFNFLRKNWLTWGILAFFGSFFLASIFSVDPHFSFWNSPYRAGGTVTLAFYIIFTFLAFLIFERRDWNIAWTFAIGTGLIVALLAIIQFYGLFNKVFVSVDIRPGSTVGNPILLGIYLLLLFFVTFYKGLKAENLKWKIFYFASAVIFIFAIFLSGSRSCYIGLLTGFLYFVFFYFPKNKLIKTTTVILVLICLFFIYYINTVSQLPSFITKNKTLESFVNRLSIDSILKQERFPSWKITWQAIKDRPILGYGPENLSVGFDKYYDPKIVESPWWDRAHNVFLDILIQTGFIGLAAYLFFLGTIFWGLWRLKKNLEYRQMALALEAMMIAYIIANIFSFDSFTSYLILFFVLSNILYLLYFQEGTIKNKNQTDKPSIIFAFRKTITPLTLIIITFFIWQYNLMPLLLNSKINIAQNTVQARRCANGLSYYEKLIEKKSILDSYIRMFYVEDLRTCIGLEPEKSVQYVAKGYHLLQENIKLQPTYTRYWLFAGIFASSAANIVQDQTEKMQFVKAALDYFKKTEELAPKHQEIMIERSRAYMAVENYQAIIKDMERCSDLKPNYYQCYWIKALAHLYLNQDELADQSIKEAEKYGFVLDEVRIKYQLLGAYDKNKRYDKIAPIYEWLIEKDKNFSGQLTNYHSALAFTYYKLGQYKKARQHALAVLELDPNSQKAVNDFLKLLPR